MNSLLQTYASVVGEDVIRQLMQLAKPLRGMKVVHVNSTRQGGGVAEILEKMVPLMRELGMDTHWEVITGQGRFYECTKLFHNGMQGNQVILPEVLLNEYKDTNRVNAESLAPVLRDADIVFIHDPQPAALIDHFPN